MKAQDIMRTPVASVLAHTPISSVLAVIVAKHLNVVAVCDEAGALVGIVSEGDILRRKDRAYIQSRAHWMNRVAEGKPLDLEFLHRLNSSDGKIIDIMSKPVISVDVDASLDGILEMLVSKGIRQVLVTEHSGLVGLVTRSDALRATMRCESPGRPG
jgi:CBS domain-containing protein